MCRESCDSNLPQHPCLSWSSPGIKNRIQIFQCECQSRKIQPSPTFLTSISSLSLPSSLGFCFYQRQLLSLACSLLFTLTFKPLYNMYTSQKHSWDVYSQGWSVPTYLTCVCLSAASGVRACLPYILAESTYVHYSHYTLKREVQFILLCSVPHLPHWHLAQTLYLTSLQ